MKFFIDTANIDQIKEAHDLGVLDGVTTNPSLMAKEGISGDKAIMKHYEKICKLVEGDVSAEVIATDFEGIIKEGKELTKIAPNIVVKVPMIKDGVKALKYLYDHDIRTNCTLVFSAGQAILAAKAGANYVSPFIGRIDDINWEGMQVVAEIAEIYAIQGYETEILAASIRSSKHIVEAAKSGADVVTCP
ncbi:MAG: transaldolase family protein, partial [Saprospiraceae bacterium]|nr:transaldolase family protein [Saprospiraceae bacterium]